MEYQAVRPRLLPRSRENPSQTEKAIGRNSPGANGGARGCAKRPLEDDRPFALVVARDAGDIPGVVRRDVRASPAGELKGIGARQIEEPEIDGVLGVAEDEVGLAGARRHLRRNLDRDCVGELGWRCGRRRCRALQRDLPRPRAGRLPDRRSAARGAAPPAAPLPPPLAAREATDRSSPCCPLSCRSIERGRRSTRHRRWPEPSRRWREDGTARPGSMICPMIGKRATGADAKLAAPFARSIGSRTCLATTRLV